MVMSWLGRLHGVFLIWGLLFLGASIFGAAGAGFAPDRDRYMEPEFPFKNSGRPRFVLNLFPDPSGRTLLILDGAEGQETRGVPPEVLGRLSKFLSDRGMNVVRSAGRDAMPLAKNADLVILACDLPQYLDLDFETLAATMRGRYLFDYSGYWAAAQTESDQAGLAMINFARQFWPHWLDPDLQTYVEHLREVVPAGDGILLLPGRYMSSTVTRSRWFLPLNYKLADRRLYLWNPQLGTSFITEYFEWVLAYREKDPWSVTEVTEIPERTFSKLTDFAPTRTLTPDEAAAAQTHNVQWILFWSHQPDFHTADWELVPLETALSWGEEAGS